MRRLVGLVMAAALTITPRATAQNTGRGFLFTHPVGSISLRGGFNIPAASSDIFSFTIDQLTHDRNDFNAWSGGADIAMWVAPRWDLVLTGLYAGESKLTEFRHWVDTNDRPIQQRTTFERVPLLVGARYYLVARGRSIGSYAWVPARHTAYVGGGLGATWYRFHQRGSFIDFSTLNVFTDEFKSERAGVTAAAFAGAEWAISDQFSLSSELLYSVAHARLSRDFVDFEPIDLSGFFATVGLSFRLVRWPKWN